MGRAKPYADIDDLPEEEVSGFSRAQKAAFKQAWNRAADKGKKEDVALREARMQAKQQNADNP